MSRMHDGHLVVCSLYKLNSLKFELICLPPKEKLIWKVRPLACGKFINHCSATLLLKYFLRENLLFCTILEAQPFGTNRVNSLELTPFFARALHSCDVCYVFSIFVLQNMYVLVSYCCAIDVFMEGSFICSNDLRGPSYAIEF